MLYLLIASAVLVPAIHGSLVNVTQIVEQVNSQAGTWTADTYGLTQMDMKYVKSRLGLKSRHGSLGFYYPQPRPESLSPSGASSTDNLPENFSWLDGNSTSGNYGCPVGDIRDQANCGCCWAISTVPAYFDRSCIASNGTKKRSLSFEHMLACSNKNEGCDGGYLDKAHQFLVDEGTTTGGNYDSNEGCQPYSIPPCEQSGCTSEAETPKCIGSKCSNKAYSFQSEPNMTKASDWYRVGSRRSMTANEYAIRKDMYDNGPVVAGFRVYYDFMTYRSGIYQHRTRRVAGNHAVRMLGWGVQNGVKYWLIANSWGTSWGDNGFAKIIRGRNECGIESSVVAALP